MSYHFSHVACRNRDHGTQYLMISVRTFKDRFVSTTDHSVVCAMTAAKNTPAVLFGNHCRRKILSKAHHVKTAFI